MPNAEPHGSIATQVLSIDPTATKFEIPSYAIDLLRKGEVVAFPTETVYGLGADALNAAAVAKIYEAKGRPATNPVIVHVADQDQLQRVVSQWPQKAQLLAEAFWPGPLTIVVAKSSLVPSVVTAGGATVAVRMPAHPIALALIRAAGVPLAAPSANRSNALSPTRAEHVMASLGGWIPLILDGGPTRDGIESTVVDLTTEPPRLLRPGPISVSELEKVIGSLGTAPENNSDKPLRSPGLLAKHYAPKTALRITESTLTLESWLAESENQRRRVGLVITAEIGSILKSDGIVLRVLPSNPAAYASKLYETLHDLDQFQLDELMVFLPGNDEAWLAVGDRLRRAATR